MPLNHTDITITAVKDILTEATYNLSVISQSVNTNKWGLFRYYFTGGNQLRPHTINTKTSTDHLNELQSSPYLLGHFRGYYHEQIAPGWYSSFSGTQLPITGTLYGFAYISGTGGSVDVYFVSIGAYDIEIVYIDGDDWVTSIEPLTEGVAPTIVGSHTYETDIDGDLTGGKSNIAEVGPTSDNALYGKVRITLPTNPTTQRQVHIRLKNANSYAGDVVPYKLVVTQYSNVFAVSPLLHTWTYSETTAKFSDVSVPYGVAWTYSSIPQIYDADEESFGADLTITKTTDSTGSGNLRFQPTSNEGNWKKRRNVIRVTRSDTTAYEDITVTQAADPNITPP